MQGWLERFCTPCGLFPISYVSNEDRNYDLSSLEIIALLGDTVRSGRLPNLCREYWGKDFGTFPCWMEGYKSTMWWLLANR
jgi:hypothetical protein